MATLIKFNGDTQKVFPAGDVFTLEEMYDLLNCECVQAIMLNSRRAMWIDEEGKIKPHHVNQMASLHLLMAGGIPGDYVAGDALVTETHEIE